MLMRPSPPGLRAEAELGDRCCAWMEPRTAQQLPVSYLAFCSDHWAVYQRFGAAAAGSRHAGSRIARAALRDLGEQWHRALRSSSPAAHAWGLLSRRASENRTAPRYGLHGLLDRDAADALVLRYRLGLPPRRAGHAMGLSEAGFELLRRRALRDLLPTHTL
ncbi:hypothetical protein ABT112_02215 [Streptomyces sp. NPDC002055]|uniref:hypothetical protein n=1 Tax=Streptomyces sp. NPDC002055 TaxID=3154534 RepID=UPI003320C9F1